MMELEPDAPEVADRESLARALQNLQDSEARVQRHAAGVYEETRSKLVQALLPVLDNLDRTLRAAGTRSDALVEGVRLVRDQLLAVLRGYGVEVLDARGHAFDPAIHEAIATVAVGDPRSIGMVIHQLEPGYRSGGKLLRAAKVTVAVAS